VTYPRLAIAVLAAVLALVTPAHAALTAVGPVDPVNGFPAWYQDANGVQLVLCIADPGCPLSPAVADFVAPDGEAFYQLASATVTAPNGGTVTVDFNVEGAFLGTGPDAQITFGRLQVGMSGMQPNATYTVTHPYGSGQWTTDAAGDLLRGARAAARHEVGCGAPPCNFAAALGTELGPFLQWDPAQSMPPAGYVGDGLTPHTIVGPAGTSVTVTGPGLPAGGISTNLFTVAGKLAGPAVPVFFAAPGSGDFGTQRAGTSTTRTITVKNNGLAPMASFTGASITGADAASFSVGTDTCTGTALASGKTCTVAVNYAAGAVGANSASLVLTDAAGASNTVALTGTAATSALTADPGVVDFFNQAVGTTSPAETVTLENTGRVALNVSGATIAGPNADEFGISGNGCRAPVAPGGTCRVAVKFFPSATGPRNASLSVASDASPTPYELPLAGSGTGISTGARTGSAPVAPAPRLAVSGLRMRRRLTARQAARGLKLAMTVPAGTKALRLRVYRRVHHARLVWSGSRRPSAGAYRVRLTSRALRRALRPGSYVLEATPDGGVVSRITFRVIA